MTHIAVVVMEGVLDSSLGITLDTLGAAANLVSAQGGTLSIQPVSSGRATHVRTGSGLHLSGLTPQAWARQPDVVLLPGCNVSRPEQLAAWLNQPEVHSVRDWLVGIVPTTRLMASGCVGTFVMAAAGLLNGRAATTTWWLAREFQRLYPDVKLDMKRIVVDEGKYLTAGAALAQIDLTLSVVRRLFGDEIARRSASFMLADERQTQAHFAVSSVMAQPHPDVTRAERWIHQNLGRAFSIDELADALHLTPRTLARRFVEAIGTPPYHFVQRIRLERAHQLLQTTAEPLQHIAEAVGYQNASTLTRAFKRFDFPNPAALRRAVRR